MKKLNNEKVIVKKPIPGLTLLLVKTGVRGVVTISGSFLGGDCYAPKGNPMTPAAVVAMLTEGTKRRAKEELHDALESLGIEIDFSLDAHRIRFVIRSRSSVADVALAFLADMLREPAFSQVRFKTVQKRMLGEIEEAKEDPFSVAHTEFLRLIFSPTHPEWDYSFPAKQQALRKLKVADLSTFHSHAFGRGSFILSAVGDIQPERLERTVLKHFGDWHQSTLTPVAKIARARRGNLVYLTLRDKATVNVFMGVAVPLVISHNAFIPLTIGVSALGDSFGSRLFDHFREDLGISYRVYARLSGFAAYTSGYLELFGSFPPERLLFGRRELEKELTHFVGKGITPKEFSDRKESLMGRYVVTRATTGGLSALLLSIFERGLGLDYFYTYPERVRRTTLAEVNDAIRTYIADQKISTAVAGSIDARGKPLQPPGRPI